MSAEVFGEIEQFYFHDSVLDVKIEGGKKVYTGCIDVQVTDSKNVLMDITCLDDFSEAIVSYTSFDEADETQKIMLYGDTFEEQQALYADEIDLREGGNSTYAHKNGYRGVIFKVSYRGEANCASAVMTATANITYRIYLNTGRTTYWKTGTLTITHNVYFE